MTNTAGGAVIVEAVRTAIGRGHFAKGIFRDLHPNVILGEVYRLVLQRVDLDPGRVAQVITGCVQKAGPQGTNIARNAWLEAGLPIHIPATTLEFQCRSSQQAAHPV